MSRLKLYVSIAVIVIIGICIKSKKINMRDMDFTMSKEFRFRVVRIPGDGDCFFSAIGMQIGVDSKALRKKCILLFKNSDKHEQVLMAIGNDSTNEGYMKRLANGMFGGHNEMILISNHYNITIYVYTRTNEGFRKLTTVRPRHTTTSKQVFLLWDGDSTHYDALSVV